MADNNRIRYMENVIQNLQRQVANLTFEVAQARNEEVNSDRAVSVDRGDSHIINIVDDEDTVGSSHSDESYHTLSYALTSQEGASAVHHTVPVTPTNPYRHTVHVTPTNPYPTPLQLCTSTPNHTQFTAPNNTTIQVIGCKSKPLQSVPTLRFDDLKGMYANHNIKRFCKQIEYLEPDDTSRIDLALLNIENIMATQLERALEEYRKPSWLMCKQELFKLFGKGVTETEAITELQLLNLDENEDPNVFVSKFLGKCEILEQIVGRKLGEARYMLKEKLFKAIPREYRSQLGYLLLTDGDDYKRLLAVLREKRKEVSMIRKGMMELQETSSKPDSKDMEGVEGKHTVESGVSPERPKKPYCGYCRTTEHGPPNCPLKPQRGSCFDCMRMGCRRGRPDCPGRSARSQQ